MLPVRNYLLAIATDATPMYILESAVTERLLEPSMSALLSRCGPIHSALLTGGRVHIYVEYTLKSEIIKQLADTFRLADRGNNWAEINLKIIPIRDKDADEVQLLRFIGWILRRYQGDAVMTTDHFDPGLIRRDDEIILGEWSWEEAELSALGLLHTIQHLETPIGL
jgi:hypothetical protein